MPLIFCVYATIMIHDVQMPPNMSPPLSSPSPSQQQQLFQQQQQQQQQQQMTRSGGSGKGREGSRRNEKIISIRSEVQIKPAQGQHQGPSYWDSRPYLQKVQHEIPM